MQHQLKSEGYGVRLRPVTLEDAAFIVWLRNLGHAVGRVGDSAADIASQQAWLQKYFARPDDYYWLVETVGGLPLGTYGLWDFHEGSAESGRWIMRPNVPGAIPSAILGLDLGFGPLGLKMVRVKTVVSNAPVLSLNRKFGMKELGVEKDSVQIGGQWVDQIRFTLAPEDWRKAREKMLLPAAVAEKQIAEWEKTERQNPAKF
jgi:RimJ/RimL family protein N-acetyltransferase